MEINKKTNRGGTLIAFIRDTYPSYFPQLSHDSFRSRIFL